MTNKSKEEQIKRFFEVVSFMTYDGNLNCRMWEFLWDELRNRDYDRNDIVSTEDNHFSLEDFLESDYAIAECLKRFDVQKPDYSFTVTRDWTENWYVGNDYMLCVTDDEDNTHGFVVPIVDLEAIIEALEKARITAAAEFMKFSSFSSEEYLSRYSKEDQEKINVESNSVVLV